MTTTDIKEKVRAKIIAAVPEINNRPSILSFNGRKEIGVPDNNGPEITLADVMRAMHKATGGEWFVMPWEETEVQLSADLPGNRLVCYWNLSLPLDEQEPEVWEFIGKILDV